MKRTYHPCHFCGGEVVEQRSPKMRDYTVILHPAEEGGYWVDVPALPGCYSQGETEEEALVRIREAIEAHIEVL
jgi:HicB-like antitoxin of HicAB toxin-antitoxin system